jgi:hypothetical protein
MRIFGYPGDADHLPVYDEDTGPSVGSIAKLPKPGLKVFNTVVYDPNPPAPPGVTYPEPLLPTIPRTDVELHTLSPQAQHVAYLYEKQLERELEVPRMAYVVLKGDDGYQQVSEVLWDLNDARGHAAELVEVYDYDWTIIEIDCTARKARKLTPPREFTEEEI